MSGAIDIRSDITEAYFGHAWRAKRAGHPDTVHATVRLGHSTLTFDSSTAACDLVMATTQAAAALERLEADSALNDVDGPRPALLRGVPIGQTAELLECRGGDQCHTLEEFQAAADALGRVHSLQELTTVLAKVAHYAPEVIIRAVAELAP